MSPTLMLLGQLGWAEIPDDVKTSVTLADHGCRGDQSPHGVRLNLMHTPGLAQSSKNLPKPRREVEPAIGRMKSDALLVRIWITRSDGNSIHAVLWCAGRNRPLFLPTYGRFSRPSSDRSCSIRPSSERRRGKASQRRESAIASFRMELRIANSASSLRNLRSTPALPSEWAQMRSWFCPLVRYLMAEAQFCCGPVPVGTRPVDHAGEVEVLGLVTHQPCALDSWSE